MIDALDAVIVLPASVPRIPVWLADAAVVVALVCSVLPLKVMSLSFWASKPVAPAVPRFTVMLLAVIWAAEPEPISPVADAVLTVMGVGAVQAVVLVVPTAQTWATKGDARVNASATPKASNRTDMRGPPDRLLAFGLMTGI
ncbi:MAG TPA: hypothetical protein VGM26_04890 [Rhizomicrobium sp.]